MTSIEKTQWILMYCGNMDSASVGINVPKRQPSMPVVVPAAVPEWSNSIFAPIIDHEIVHGRSRGLEVNALN